ncbi:MAG TPA: phage portal protein [Gaiellales bacterium]|nr:phage portal protein [Gaiellales bacterium]
MAGRLAMALRSLRGTVLTATDGRDVLLNSPDGWEVEQPWLWWLGPAGGGQGPFGNPIPGANNGHGYGSVPAVARATGLIVDTVGTLPWHVYRGTERLSTPTWMADPQALRLDGRVVDTDQVIDARLSRIDFWCDWIRSALWWGDGFVYVPMRDAAGAPKPPLWLLHPDDVKVEEGQYFVGDTRIPATNLIHLRGQTPIVKGRGTGVLTRFAADLGLTQSLRSYMAGAFTSGVPAGYLKTSAPNITQDQADALKTRWMSQHGGNSRSIAVLNATTEFHPLAWTPVDTEAAAFATLTLGQIELMFGLPVSMLGGPAGKSLDYSTTELRMMELLQLTLLPWIGRVEAVLDAQLAAGVESRIEIGGLLRADAKTQMETLEIGIRTGLITVNEGRELLNRPPLEEAAVL